MFMVSMQDVYDLDKGYSNEVLHSDPAHPQTEDNPPLAIYTNII